VQVVPEDTPVRNAIYEISSKKMGVTAVVDAAGRLSGIISDGDLRRWMERTETTGENLLAKQARDIMTRRPKTIDENALAAEALGVMESSSITSLLIVDSGARPQGVVHLHDLLKAGVV